MTIARKDFEVFKQEFKANKIKTDKSTRIFGAIFLFWFLITLHVGGLMAYLQIYDAILSAIVFAVMVTFVMVKLNITEEERSTFYDLGKLNILMLITGVILMIAFDNSPDVYDCTDRATTPHGWDKDIYHYCMQTPKGFDGKLILTIHRCNAALHKFCRLYKYASQATVKIRIIYEETMINYNDYKKLLLTTLFVIIVFAIGIIIYLSFLACEENRRIKKAYELFSVPSSYPTHSYNDIFYTFCKKYEIPELPPEFQKQKSHKNEIGENK